MQDFNHWYFTVDHIVCMDVNNKGKHRSVPYTSRNQWFSNCERN